ncbi:PIN domain-containing protein [Nocardioides panzhihuensis]|uniref:Putative nucleic acid-binding protein n=1 Tax=Nocardioides panzhihuensis TaxID=860243 RepID=A0A7Z0DTW8_9ACTN|nr:putative nucleic acid-binding protein [Nocardioides panzhihuensis]
MFRAVLDTCVLIPSMQRDFLLQLATEGAYSPLWGSGIITELDYVLERLDQAKGRDPEESAKYRQHLLEQMTRYFPGSTIEAPKTREYHYDIADPDDGHVVHAAIIGKADVIVTSDQRAGMETSSVLAEAAVDVLSAHDFAANTVAAHPEAGARAVLAISTRLKNPPRSPAELLELLATKCNMSEVAEILLPLFAD